MDDEVKAFYDDLRKAKGRVVIFLGAGASYDYGIATMEQMAQILVRELKEEKNAARFKGRTREVLLGILGVREEDLKKLGGRKLEELGWNVEELLTRFQQIGDAVEANGGFGRVETNVGGIDVKKDDITELEKEVLGFVIECMKLNGYKKTGHGGGSIEYLSTFIKLMGEFEDSIRIFTTNVDLCIEAGLIGVSQEGRRGGEKRFELVDGFSHGLVPTFGIENYALDAPKSANTVRVYLWKLHGSVDWVFTNPLATGGATESRQTYGDDSIICKTTSKEVWKELSDAGAMSQDVSGDPTRTMIFPTPDKYSQTYTYPYMELYEAFRRTLQEGGLLLGVGTSFPDRHINSAVKRFLARADTHLYLVDPVVTNEDMKIKLGEYNTIKPVIKKGFKEFVEALRQLEEAERAEAGA
jgi:hypothetical protein